MTTRVDKGQNPLTIDITDPISSPAAKGGGGGGGIKDPRLREAQLVAILPRDFRAEPGGGGVRLKIIDRDKLVAKSGSVRYVFSHAAEVDTSTEAGRRAGFSRSEFCGECHAPGEEGRESSTVTTDARFTSGTFFCVAVNGRGERSHDFLWAQVKSEAILDSTIPDDVTRFSVSESGFEVSPGVMVSEVAASAYAPSSSSFDGLQLYLKDYTSVGSIERGAFHRHNGQPGGRIDFKARYSPYRRGSGTVTMTAGGVSVTGAGTQFVSQAQAGDLIEVLRVRATVQSVSSDGLLTLVAPWTGPTIATADYVFLPLVTVYGISVSKAGTRRSDITGAPNHAVLFDAELSAPNAPSVTLSVGGNIIRAAVTVPTGTQIDRVILHRGTGAAVAFASCTPIKTWPADQVNVASTLYYEDADFTLYQREVGQTFTYYATCLNVRGEESLPSAAKEASCRLDGSGENGPTVPSRNVIKNLFWNSHILGTVGASVSSVDTAQDTGMGGGAPPTGHNRWYSFVTGTGTLAGHENTTEVILPAPGAASDVFFSQKIGAWDHATAGAKRVDKGSYVAFSVYARTSGGHPNGAFILRISQRSGGVEQGFAKLRERDASDDINETSEQLVIPGLSMDTSHQRYYGIFLLDPSFTTDEIWAEMIHANSSNGVNILVTKAMLSPGEELGAWTPELLDPDISYPPPTGAAPIPGPYLEDGYRRGFTKTP